MNTKNGISHAILRILALLALFVVGAAAQGTYFSGQAKTVRAGTLAPVPYADIYVCASGVTCSSTSAHVTVYSDAALTQVITQPIVADVYGNFGFYASPATYVYNVSGRGIQAENFTITLPPACDGSGNCSAKSIEQFRYADQFPGSDIGAQINAAIADLGTSGGTVIIPRGAYTLNTSVSITQPNICIKAQGAQATSISLASTFNSDAFKWDIGGVDSSTPLQNGCLEGLTIYGNAQANAVGVHITDTTGLVLRDVAIMNFTGTGAKGVYLDNETAWTERTVFDHVTTQNNTYSYYFYKGASTSGSFGYTSWLASHITANNGQVGIYIASGADLYHSTLNFKANLAPYTNSADSTLVEVAGTMNQDACSVTGEFTGTPVGAGTNYGIKNDTAAAVSCPGIFDVASSVNSGPVFVGQAYEDGADSTLWNTLPDGTTAFPTLTDRADTSLGNTHPYFGLYESNANSKTGFAMDFHNCITADSRCGLLMFNSSGATNGWLTTATQWGSWTADGKFQTSNIVQSVTPGSVSAGFRAANGTGNFQFTVGCSAANANDSCLYDVTSGHFPWQVNASDQVTFNYLASFAAGINLTGTLQGGTVNATTLQQGGVQAAITGVDINASNQVTSTHLVSPLPTAQGGTGVNSTATFPGSGTVAVTSQLPLSGTTASIGGSALAAGACSSGTATVTGATTSMVAEAGPTTYPGDGAEWSAYVSAANTVTVKVCAIVALTPTASTYNVRVIQ